MPPKRIKLTVDGAAPSKIPIPIAIMVSSEPVPAVVVPVTVTAVSPPKSYADAVTKGKPAAIPRRTKSKSPAPPRRKTNVVTASAENDQIQIHTPEISSGIPAVGAVASIKSSNISVSHHEVEYEFGGPLGALGVIVGLPVVIYALFFLCNKEQCITFRSTTVKSIELSWSDLLSKEAAYIYLGWMLFHVILERLLPGEIVDGAVLPNGKSRRLTYCLSGHLQFWITMLLLTVGYPYFEASKFVGFRAWPLYTLYDNYLQLIGVSVVFSTALALFL